MSVGSLLAHIETQTGQPLTPAETSKVIAAREASLSRLLMLYIATGSVFMLLPGTIWGAIAALLGVWAASVGNSYGFWGASRHALTVGFLAMMVFAVGQRILPAFSGMRLLFSTKLMFMALLLLTIGCLMRVSSEILAYQGFASSAWSWLPASALIEMAAVTVLASNLAATFAGRPTSAHTQIGGTRDARSECNN